MITPEGIDAWLSTICRHVSRRWIRWEQTNVARHTRLSLLASEQNPESPREREFLDPLTIDSIELGSPAYDDAT
jgi:hypothetical protein